jgi:hypothetical protein
MQNEPLFKYLAAALIAAVILAFLNPAPVKTGTDHARTVTSTHPVSVSAKS